MIIKTGQPYRSKNAQSTKKNADETMKKIPQKWYRMRFLIWLRVEEQQTGAFGKYYFI